MRVALIGSGLTAVGALLALQRIRGLQLDHYIGDNGNAAKSWSYYNEQMASSVQAGGLSQFWHGVIPVISDYSSDADFRQIFNYFYGSIDEQSDLFIPYRPIRGKIVCRKLISTMDLKALTIKGMADLNLIEFCSGETHRESSFNEYDLIILAIGELEFSELLHLKGIKHEVVDHICGFVGKSHISNFADALNVKHVWTGHYRRCILVSDTTIFTGRPAASHFLPKKKMAEINYGVSKKEIMAQLLKAGNIGKIKEAIFNRYGLTITKTDYLNIHYQKTVPVELDHKNKVVNFPNLSRHISPVFSEFEEHLGSLEMKPDINFYPGTHLRVKLDYNFHAKLVTPLLEPNYIYSPFHHSFQKLVQMYKRVNKFSEEYI
jgi:hypothetical protein